MAVLCVNPYSVDSFYGVSCLASHLPVALPQCLECSTSVADVVTLVGGHTVTGIALITEADVLREIVQPWSSP